MGQAGSRRRAPQRDRDVTSCSPGKPSWDDPACPRAPTVTGSCARAPRSCQEGPCHAPVLRRRRRPCRGGSRGRLRLLTAHLEHLDVDQLRRRGLRRRATSAQALGGMDALVAAANKEGTLNVIALPPDWANYGEIINAFTRRSTAIKVNVRPARRDQPGRDQRREPAEGPGDRARTSSTSGSAVGAASTATVRARTRSRRGPTSPTNLKDADGLWVNDYGGYMSIGYDAQGRARARRPSPTCSSPSTRARSRSTATRPRRARLQRRRDGRRWPTAARPTTSPPASTSSRSSRTPATSCRRPDPGHRRSRTDAGRHRLGLPQRRPGRDAAGHEHRLEDRGPAERGVGGFYVQAINKDAPHPAAARLWEEFLYSDEGQNLWLKGGARPVRADAMKKAGTIDETALQRPAEATGTPVLLTAGAERQGHGRTSPTTGKSDRLTAVDRRSRLAPTVRDDRAGRRRDHLRRPARRGRGAASLLGVVPFFAYVAVSCHPHAGRGHRGVPGADGRLHPRQRVGARRPTYVRATPSLAAS